MKTTALAAAVILASASAASAADLSARYYKAPAPAAAVQINNWTGFYLGAFGGYGGGGTVSAYEPSDGLEKFSGPRGGFGGVTVGYNWQAPGSNFVWGLEGDFAGGSLTRSYQDPQEAFSSQVKIKSFGSVTGRVGMAFDPVLLYVKGGYGFAHAELVGSNGVNSFSSSKTHSGYTIGGGAEMMFARNWSAKLEYMYADYGKKLHGPTPDGDFADIGLTTHTLKAGVNYRF